MSNNIKYIAYFDFPYSKVKRNYAISAANKIEYAIESFIKSGYNVELISASAVTETKLKWYKKEKHRTNSFITHFLPSFGCKSKILKKIRTLFTLIELYIYILTTVKRSDTVIVYHSLGFRNIILWSKKIIKFNLILEVEEIYQDVTKYSSYLKNIEYKMFDIADAYIFSTESLNNKLNKLNKPYIISYGTYKIEEIISPKYDDGKIHIVYAGTFDPNKGGAIAAIQAAEHLSPKYHVHIIGFGNKKDTQLIKTTILNSSKNTEATITFDGLLKGKEYIQFIQKCHIGLSTQNPYAEFNNTSFPSKILSYMSNGLSVVSIKIDVIVNSEIGSYINYYTEQTPENIAEAIIRTNIVNNNRTIISELDNKFIMQIKNIKYRN